MTEVKILGALVLVGVVSVTFFTCAGRTWFEERCDALDLFLLNVQQRWQERRRRSEPRLTQARGAWAWNGKRKEWE